MQLLSSHCLLFCISPSLSYILYWNWFSAQDTPKLVVRVNIKQFKRTVLNKLFLRPCAKSHLLRSDRGNEEGKDGKAHEANAIKFCAACNVKTHLGPTSNMYTWSASRLLMLLFIPTTHGVEGYYTNVCSYVTSRWRRGRSHKVCSAYKKYTKQRVKSGY